MAATTHRGRRAFSCRLATVFFASLAGAGCGGTTGTEGAPPIRGSSAPDATVGDPFDLDGGPFDVAIQYVDRVLPEVGPPPGQDSGGDAASVNAWPCPPDLCALPDDAGFGDPLPDGACPGGFVAAAFADGGGVIPAPSDSICASCSPYNGGAGCTPTEQLFVLHDPVPPADGGMTCYQCLVNAGALDDTVFPDTGHECNDSPLFMSIPEFPDAAVQQDFCFQTLKCILGTSPSCVDVANAGPADCFCGAGVTTLACAAPMFQPTGSCAAEEAAGFGQPASATVAILNMFTNTAWGSGQANQIFTAGISSGCTRCAQ